MSRFKKIQAADTFFSVRIFNISSPRNLLHDKKKPCSHKVQLVHLKENESHYLKKERKKSLHQRELFINFL